VILPRLLGWDIHQNDDFFLAFLVATHLATALVLFAFFLEDWKRIAGGLVRSLRERQVRPDDVDARLGWLLVVGTIPVGLIGLLAEKSLRSVFASPASAAIFLFGNGIMLLVAQSGSQSGILQIHRPEFCYTAGGYTLTPSVPHPVQLPGRELPALSISATREARTEQIVYWTRIGSHLPTSWTQQRLAVAMDNLKGFIPDAVMVRVSTYGNDKPLAYADVDEFIRALMAKVTPQVRRVLIG